MQSLSSPKAELRGLKVLPPHGAWVTEATTAASYRTTCFGNFIQCCQNRAYLPVSEDILFAKEHSITRASSSRCFQADFEDFTTSLPLDYRLPASFFHADKTREDQEPFFWLSILERSGTVWVRCGVGWGNWLRG